MLQWGYKSSGPGRTARRVAIPLAIGIPAWYLGTLIHGAVTGLVFAILAIVAGALL
jgi:hypothetical protein